jgi:hypothetical protein
MKTMTWIKIGLVSGFALAGSGAGLAQRSCLPFGYGGNPKPEYVTCTVTMEFVRPVDLDGDGVADFTHERARAVGHWGEPEWDPNYPRDYVPQWYHQDDTIEALYPAGHVEVYWSGWWERDDWGVHASPRVPAGWPLPHPSWPWGKFWDYPVVHAQGLGVIFRRAQWSCELEGTPSFICGRTYYTGYVPPWEDWPSDHTEEVTEQYFGFRLRRADGWHLGWLRLRWHWVFGGVTPDPLELVDWAVHPEAEAGIVVGEPARPQLRCAREGEELVLQWSPVWTNAVLERAVAPAGAGWEAVAGVTNATVRVPAHGPAAFYRLQVR